MFLNVNTVLTISNKQESKLQSKKPDDDRLDNDLRDGSINVNQNKDDGLEVLNLLQQFANIWDGYLEHIITAERRDELTDERVRPVHRTPYSTVPTARLFEGMEIDRMLQNEFIAPSTTEWAGQIVFTMKKNSPLRFCVDYCKLDTVTIDDSYLLPRMKERIVSLGVACIFPNKRYLLKVLTI